jgi:hypothetical protein
MLPLGALPDLLRDVVAIRRALAGGDAEVAAPGSAGESPA